MRTFLTAEWRDLDEVSEALMKVRQLDPSPPAVPLSRIVSVYYDSQPPLGAIRVAPQPMRETRWTTLRVVEPLWFEEARLDS